MWCESKQVLGVQGVAVELAGGDDPQHMRGAAGQTHLLIDAQVFVDFDEVACWEDLDGVGIGMLHMLDGLRCDANLLEAITQFPILRQDNNCMHAHRQHVGWSHGHTNRNHSHVICYSHVTY